MWVLQQSGLPRVAFYPIPILQICSPSLYYLWSGVKSAPGHELFYPSRPVPSAAAAVPARGSPAMAGRSYALRICRTDG